MPKRSNDFQQLVHMMETALIPTGAKVTESVMELGREIDVLIVWTVGLHPIRMAVEAKDEARPLDVGVIEQYIGKYHGPGCISVNKVIVVSRHGFTQTAIERGEQAGFDLLTLDEAIRSDWTHKVPQQLAWRMPPHIDRVELLPPIPKDGNKDPLADGRFVCKCHGRDVGSPLQWAEWFLRTQVLANSALLGQLDTEARKRNGTIMASVPLPMSNQILLFNEQQYENLELKLDIHYVNGSGPVKWSTYNVSSNQGTRQTVDQMEAVLGGQRMRILFPDGPTSKKLTVRFDSAPTDSSGQASNLPSETFPFGTLPTTLRPADMPPARPMNHQLPDLHSNRTHPPSMMLQKRIGRNDPCSCGSGKKYKNCCRRKTG